MVNLVNNWDRNLEGSVDIAWKIWRGITFYFLHLHDPISDEREQIREHVRLNFESTATSL